MAADHVRLPGFRFHPTEEELLSFYLMKTSTGKMLCSDVIGFLNIYLHDPWDLPGLAKIGEREWYFFVHRDKRNGHGGRPNRTTENGFWKATGSDRSIRSSSEPRRVLGLKKTLVFYIGRAPKGTKTDWVMNEYRLPADQNQYSSSHSNKEDIVLCKIYRKATSLKILEQRAAAMEGQSRSSLTTLSSDQSCSKDITNYSTITTVDHSFLLQQECFGPRPSPSYTNEEDHHVDTVNNILPSAGAIFSLDLTTDNSWWIPFLWNMEQYSPLADNMQISLNNS